MRKYPAAVFFSAVVGALTGCSDQAPAEKTVMALGDLPVANLSSEIPKAAIVCFGLHLGLVTGDTNATLPADIRATCAQAADSLSGSCRAYAEAASELGEKAKTAERDAAELKADAALARCRRDHAS